MYKCISKIKTSSGWLYMSKDELLTKIEFDSKVILVRINDEIETEPYKCFDNDSIYRFVFTNCNFIASYENKGTVFYSKNCSILKEFNETMYFTQTVENDICIYIKNKEKIYRYNKIENTIDLFSTEKKLLLEAVYGNYILEKNKSRISIKADYKSSIDLIWQKEFTELLKYQYDGKEKTGEIKQVKLYKDSLIVVSDGGVIRLLLATGEIIWKNNAYARTMEIVGEIGYVCAGLSLYKVNLETGEIIRYGYNNNYNRLPDIEYQGSSYWAIGHEVIYHEGLLWYAVFSSGESFVIAINPHDGKYEWIHHVDTYEKIESIQFYDNKMFLLDTGNDLHIYKKQNE